MLVLMKQFIKQNKNVMRQYRILQLFKISHIKILP